MKAAFEIIELLDWSSLKRVCILLKQTQKSYFFLQTITSDFAAADPGSAPAPFLPRLILAL